MAVRGGAARAPAPADGRSGGGLPEVPELDRLIHEPARFRIMALLFVVESGDFLFLMRQTGMTGGNLSSHLAKLEEAGYIEVVKEFLGRRPHTMLRLTRRGKSAFSDYHRKMRRVLDGLPR